MKTTVEIDDQLLRQAKIAAIERGVSLRSLIENGLRGQLVPPPHTAVPPIQWITAPAPLSLPPEVDIASRKSMWEWFERERS